MIDVDYQRSLGQAQARLDAVMQALEGALGELGQAQERIRALEADLAELKGTPEPEEPISIEARRAPGGPPGAA